MTESIGIIAGKGKLPRLACDTLQKRGKRVVVVGFEPETESRFEDVEFRRIEPGNLGSIPEFFNSHDVDKLIMLGDVDKTRLHDSEQRQQADSVVRGILDSVSQRGDLALLKAAEKYLRVNGLTLVGIDRLFPDWLTPSGHHAGPEPDSEIRRTRDVLLPVARWIADNDIGQTALGHQGNVVALEAVEGTRSCIERAGSLAGDGCTMVKLARSNQDLRFDVPVIGIETIRKLVEIDARALFWEAGTTVWLQREQCRTLAERHELSLIGWKEAPWWTQWLPNFNG